MTHEDLSRGLRVMRDIVRLQANYPGLQSIIDLKSGWVAVVGTVTLKADCGMITPISLEIRFPDTYPNEEPHIYDVESRFEHIADRHFYSNGRLCLWYPEDTVWFPEDPEAIINLMDHVMTYLDRQTIFDVIGRWPGGERSHGLAGYKEYQEEKERTGINPHVSAQQIQIGSGKVGRNAPCPCGSGRKYKYCHGMR